MKLKIAHFFLISHEITAWSIFQPEKLAFNLLTSKSKSNSGFLEETIRRGDFKRECLEEQCNLEEYTEAVKQDLTGVEKYIQERKVDLQAWCGRFQTCRSSRNSDNSESSKLAGL